MDNVTPPATPALPVWVQPVELDAWTTQRIGSRELRYTLAMPSAWHTEPHLRSTATEQEHTFYGFSPVERLIVSFMSQADPEADLSLWVEATQRATGFPVPALTLGAHPARLLAWQSLGDFPALNQRLNVDETHLYEGVAFLPEAGTLARLYVLLARRATDAWQITLAFESACPPGTPAEMVRTNDHVRGGATFGFLTLL